MATAKRRYRFEGPDDQDLVIRADADPLGSVLKDPVYRTVSYEDTNTDVVDLDEYMLQQGWRYDPIPPQYVIEPDPLIGGQNSSWSYAMGTEISIKPDGDGASITNLSVKLGPGALNNNPHSWALRKSTVVSPGSPLLNSYTQIIDSGIHTVSQADTWEVLSTSNLPVVVSQYEWYILQIWIGGGGQYAPINDLRNLNLLHEDLAQVNAGTYVFVSGSPPGSTPVPTARSTFYLYGLTNFELTP